MNRSIDSGDCSLSSRSKLIYSFQLPVNWLVLTTIRRFLKLPTHWMFFGRNS